MIELGRLDALDLGTLRATVEALGGRVDVRMQWRGPDLDRLLDEDHARVAASVKRRLESWRWQVRVEHSYSHYGERGRIDLLAFHPPARILLVVEVKSELVDVQGLLGALDQKSRLAPFVVRPFGWSSRAVVPAIVFLEHSATRKRLRRYDTLFDRFVVRGRAAGTWLRNPTAVVPSGLLWFTAAGERASAPRERIRHSRLGQPPTRQALRSRRHGFGRF